MSRAAARLAAIACVASTSPSSSSPLLQCTRRLVRENSARRQQGRREFAPFLRQLGVNSRAVRSMAIPSSAPDAPAHPQERQPSSLIELLSDWYWEQDTEFRFTVISSRRPDNSADPFPYVGRKHWEQP